MENNRSQELCNAIGTLYGEHFFDMNADEVGVALAGVIIGIASDISSKGGDGNRWLLETISDIAGVAADMFAGTTTTKPSPEEVN